MRRRDDDLYEKKDGCVERAKTRDDKDEEGSRRSL
jgi:hypothetical protein